MSFCCCCCRGLWPNLFLIFNWSHFCCSYSLSWHCYIYGLWKRWHLGSNMKWIGLDRKGKKNNLHDFSHGGQKNSAIKKFTVKKIGKVLMHKKPKSIFWKSLRASRISPEPEIQYTNSGYGINLHCFTAILKLTKAL